MPKKTRKEKIRGDTRRENVSIHPNSSTYSFSLSPESALTSKKLVESPQFIFIRQDIAKTVVLGFIFIALEIGLFVVFKTQGW